MFILSYEVRLQKRDYSTCNNARYVGIFHYLFWHWCTSGPVFFGGFWNHSYSYVRSQIYRGMGAGVRGRSHMLGEGIRWSVRLGIGMISKSVKKDGTTIVHQCLFFCSRLLIQLNGAWKWSLSVWGLNPRPLSHESSVLTTRPQLLT